MSDITCNVKKQVGATPATTRVPEDRHHHHGDEEADLPAHLVTEPSKQVAAYQNSRHEDSLGRGPHSLPVTDQVPLHHCTAAKRRPGHWR